MPYVQPAAKRLLQPDRLNRKVLVALEVIDSVNQERVYRNLIVAAKGLDGKPLLSWSGRFVWLEEADHWPDEISVVPVNIPFELATVAPPRPAHFPQATSAERLVRIALRPTAAYDFAEVAAIRGELLERTDAPSAPVAGARAHLAWRETTNDVWLPALPADGGSISTDEHGQFGVFVRPSPTATQAPDVQKGFLRVRLFFTRGGATRHTPDDFAFVADPAAKGRIPEGQLLPLNVRLGWSDLETV